MKSLQSVLTHIVAVQSIITAFQSTIILNPLKCSGVRWVTFKSVHCYTGLTYYFKFLTFGHSGAQPSVRMGQKKNRNALSPNAEDVRRGAVGAEDRAPKARGVSMQLGGLRVRCKLPSGSGQTTFGVFLVRKCFIWQGTR